MTTTRAKKAISSQKPLVVIDSVSKQYEGSQIQTIEPLSLTIYEGELFALLGPSGCGKTTLMRMIAGFETPTSGRITIDGANMTDVPPYLRPVNMMFQSYALFPHMNVAQNVAFGLRQEKLPEAEIKKRVEEALSMVKMSDYMHRKPRQLSGGQQQRVALARSLVKRPKLLLLDEPLGALDRKNREHTQMELINIQAMLGITFIMVTHDQEEALSMANRIGVMGNGQLLQVGTPETIYEYPNSRFVADFIGSINIFEGTVASDFVPSTSKIVPVYCPDTGTTIRVYDETAPAPGTKVWIAIRPEEIGVSIAKPPPEENIISGDIIDIGFLGSLIFYHVQLTSQKIIHVSVPTSARNKSLELAVGNRIYLSWYDNDGVLLLS